jgi:DNA-binding Lrp family transcriptional regulator
MSSPVARDLLSTEDQRLIAALQCDGRLSAERAAAVLGLSTRVVHRRWAALFGDGVARVIATPRGDVTAGVMVLRIRVLGGKLDVITAALAKRDDIPFIDVSAGGDELSAILLAGPDPRNRLVFQQLPATKAVTSVDAQTVLHVFSDASDWRLDVLTPEERARLTPAAVPVGARPVDDVDRRIIAELAEDGRLPAATVAERTGHPESTVRRRLAALLADRRIVTQVVVDQRRLGLAVDANMWLRLPPDKLDAAGHVLAKHPAVHGALAVTGASGLYIAVWLRDTEALYRFLTRDLADLSITSAETVLVGRAVKRPGKPLS